MSVDQVREYLRNKIDNSWYYDARIDYGVSGRFLDAQAYGDQLQNLRITWEENGKRYASVVSWWTEYTAEQIYNIWMEADDVEELPEEPTGTQSITMSDLFTARYSDGRTTYEKPLDWIYGHQNGARVEISPCIWLWKADRAKVYFVDYIGDSVSCTLSTFSSLTEAQEYREKIGHMTEAEFEDWLINVRWKKNA